MKGKHIVEEINGVRCSVVEKNTTQERVDFLKKLLEHNGFEVYIEKSKVVLKPALKTEVPPLLTQQHTETFTIGVSDLVFNPVISIYSKKLKTLNGQIVSPSYWNLKEQKSEWYWLE